MATAKKLPSGSYRCLIFDRMEDGKRKYKSFTAPTKKEAELKATQYVIEKDDKKKIHRIKTLFVKNWKNILQSKKLFFLLQLLEGTGMFKKCSIKIILSFAR